MFRFEVFEMFEGFEEFKSSIACGVQSMKGFGIWDLGFGFWNFKIRL